MGRAGGRRRWTSVPPWTHASQHHGPVLWQRGTPGWLFTVGHAVANGIPLPKEAKVDDFKKSLCRTVNDGVKYTGAFSQQHTYNLEKKLSFFRRIIIFE
jgi:hypothetical protein